jgi:hypothetical protein
MSDDEWAAWQVPIGGRPVPGWPCMDCPVAYYREMDAAGRCDGYPGATKRNMIQQPIPGGGPRFLPTYQMRERRRAQWRAYQARKRGAA